MSYVDQVFGQGGLLAQRFDGYEPRAGQIALSRSVDAAIERGEHLLAEAPTGTGKSLAYAVPASYHAAHHGRRVVLVTANIALQEQLVGKDLPLLREVLPWHFTFALAKGRSNYLCLDRFDDHMAEALLAGTFSSPDEKKQWEAVVDWAERTPTGDISELPFEPLYQLRPRFTITSEECTGKACPRYADCFAEQAKRAYHDANVIVTNYHLFFSDLAVRAASEGQAKILPDYAAVVFDEGHKAADIARDFFGFRVTAGAVRWAARLLAPTGRKQSTKKQALPVIDADLKESLGELAETFFNELRMYRESDDYVARLRKANVARTWRPLVDGLRRAGDLYRQTVERVTLDAARKVELYNAEARAIAVASAVEQGMGLFEPEQNVYFIEQERERVALCSKPVHVAPTLRKLLFQNVARVQSVTVTSATLQTAGSFDFIACELGAEDAHELVAESPFDWKEQALLILPSGMPEPNHPRFANEVADTFVEAVRLARGRTLGLFTSYRVMNAAYDALIRARWPGIVLRQGSAPRTQLIRQFKEDVGSVLLGCESFWAGVDVPGEALSCVVIDRIPFVPPDDPVLDAIQARDRQWFKNHAIPRAIIAMRQGFGRLIRTQVDRGVVVMLDRRLTDKGYGKSFLRSLPPVRVSRDLDDVARFLDGGSK